MANVNTNVSRFWTYQADFHVSRVEDCESENSMAILKKLLRVLLADGWTIGRDPQMETPYYKSISKYYRRGRRGDLEMKASAMGRGLEVEFFQNVANVDNSNGGEYCFDRLKKMPYLLRLRTQFELRRLTEKAISLGLVNTTSELPHGAFGQLVHHRKSTARFHPTMYTDDQARMSYGNGTDADGRQLVEGDWRCAYDYTGRLVRGQVFYNINNMWWLIPNDSEMFNMGSFEMFQYDPAKHPRKRVRNPVSNMKDSFVRLMTKKRFREAAGVAEAIEKMGHTVKVNAQIELSAAN